MYQSQERVTLGRYAYRMIDKGYVILPARYIEILPSNTVCSVLQRQILYQTRESEQFSRFERTSKFSDRFVLSRSKIDLKKQTHIHTQN